MDDAKIKQIKIRSGVVTRLAKEKNYYGEEFDKLKLKSAGLKLESDTSVLNRHENLLEESRQMQADCFRRLKTAVEDLEKLVETECGKEGEVLDAARMAVEFEVSIQISKPNTDSSKSGKVFELRESPPHPFVSFGQSSFELEMADESLKRKCSTQNVADQTKLPKLIGQNNVRDFTKQNSVSPAMIFKAFAASRKGEREDMQDSHLIVDDFTPLLPHLEDFHLKPAWKDGSTVTAILILNDVAYITNLGDSRAVLCRYKPESQKCIPLTLTVDHNPSKFEERMRIQKSGGTVKDGRIMGQLEVSRSIGDGQYKNHGVSCVPDVKRCTLTDNDRYILIACDGLWKTFSNQEVLDFVASAQVESKKQLFDKNSLDEKSTKQLQQEFVCSKLAAEAVRRGSGDNVTIIIVIINDACE